MRLLIIGPQGAGKGTQATLLAQGYGIPHVSTGDLFREHIASGSQLGLAIKAFTDSGALVPDEVTQQMVTERLAAPDAHAGWLLDGFPRNLTQARWLDALLEEREEPLDLAVLLEAPDEVLLDRLLSRGRSDDTAEAISRRLAIYHRETVPMIDYYDGKTVRVDGVGEVHEVQQRLRKAIDAALHAGD
ncbi:adenylate kinase [Nakamurella endophytica]|uniref:Adenylate kinase n=1 Tax=Nakamurella endophytica TaxID=1748367 RepID=A0A917SX72_9ACTN|nr:adenylate kinase [Nakamurella endophytica]GGM03254.1 adenylate kinase [Nakamurella endophytica]